MTSVFHLDNSISGNECDSASYFSPKFLSNDSNEFFHNYDHFLYDQQDIDEIKEILNKFKIDCTICKKEDDCNEILNILKVSSDSNKLRGSFKFSDSNKKRQVRLKGNVLINSISTQITNCDSTYLNSHEELSKISLPSTPERMNCNMPKRNASSYYSHEDN